MASILEESKKARRKGILFFAGKRKILLIIFILIFVFSYGAYKVFGNAKKNEEKIIQKTTWTVRRDNLRLSLEEEGKVIAEDGVELSFSVSGDNLEIKELFVKEGDTVKKGDKIATVKTEALEFNVRTAYSNYLSAKAEYDKSLNGADEKEKKDAHNRIASAEISLNQSISALEKTKQNSENTIFNAENEIKEAAEKAAENSNVNSSKDVFEANEELLVLLKAINIDLEEILDSSDAILGVDNQYLNQDIKNNLGVKNISTLNSAKSSYVVAGDKATEMDSKIISLNFNSSHDDISLAAREMTALLFDFEKHLLDMNRMLENTITSLNFSQSSLDAYISQNTSGRIAINSKIDNLNQKIRVVSDAISGIEDYRQDLEDAERNLKTVKADAERDIKNAEEALLLKKMSLEQTKRDYESLIAPLDEAELAGANAKYISASVNLDKAQNELEKASIISPIEGEVAMLNYKAGDIIIDNSQPVAIIINNDTLFIEVNIEEADINKIEIGQKADIGFSAIEDLKLKGEVSFISLTSKTNNSGIVTYLVKIVIEKTGEEKVREGMSASVEFISAQADNVLVAPVRAIKNVEGKPSVEMATGEWRPVITGFTDGKNVEIISGIEDGDKILY